MRNVKIVGAKEAASRGCRHDVDNFAITQHAASGESVTFTWSATDDSGIAPWSYVLDRAPGTCLWWALNRDATVR